MKNLIHSADHMLTIAKSSAGTEEFSHILAQANVRLAM